MIKCKIYLLILFAFIIVSKLKSQNQFDIYYCNEDKKEILYFIKDTILCVFSNEDCLNTYSIFYGGYRLKKKRIKLKNNLTTSKSSQLNIFHINDSLVQLRFIYDNNDPIKAAQICLSNDYFQINKLSDKDGNLLLTDQEFSNFIDSMVKIEIITTGYFAKKEILLKKGRSYIFKSTIPDIYPFLPFKNKSSFKYILNENSIEIKKFNRNETILHKCKSNDFFTNFIHE